MVYTKKDTIKQDKTITPTAFAIGVILVRETGLEFDQIIHPRSILPHDVEQRKKNNQYLVVSTNDSKPCVLTVWVRSDDDFAVYQQIYPNQILADESEKGG